MAAQSPQNIVVKRLVLVQLAIAVFYPLALLPFGIVAAWSAAAGAVASLVPNLYFARKVFQFSGARQARQIVRSFYTGEAVKIGLTALLFALIFIHIQPLNVLAMFSGFVLVQSAIWVTPLLTR